LGELLDQPNVVWLTAVRLKFLTFEWRASDLIEIAHPQFRDELSRQAVANGLNIPGLSRLRWPPEAFYSNGA
jgi:hypothetical protein